MPSKQEEYIKIKKKNQYRLLIVIILTLIIVLAAYFLVGPKNIKSAKDDSAPKDTEPQINIIATQPKKTVAKLAADSTETDLSNKKSAEHFSSQMKPLIEINTQQAHKATNPVTTTMTPTSATPSKIISPSGEKAPKTKVVASTDEENSASTALPIGEESKPISTTKRESGTKSNQNINKQKPIVSVKPTTIKKENVTVQVASYLDPIQAHATKANLTAKGYPARVESYKTNNKVYYRVRVGFYGNREDANQVISKLNSLGYSAIITK